MTDTIKQKIKNNRFVRGLYFGFRSRFGYARSKFGHLCKGASFTPPMNIINPKNIFIYSDGAIWTWTSVISAPRAMTTM